METNLINKLRKYFDQRKDVAFAFLYGSQAKG
jgi:predicted nucleotidyltransferase